MGLIKPFFVMCILMMVLSARAQDVTLLTIEQFENRLKSGRDTTYIINLWATWCKPCLKEIPYFEKLSEELAGQKVKVILLSTDNRSKINTSVASMVKRLRLKNEVFVINEKSQQEYVKRLDKRWSGALPATLFINRLKGKQEFYEKELSYTELLKIYGSI